MRPGTFGSYSFGVAEFGVALSPSLTPPPNFQAVPEGESIVNLSWDPVGNFSYEFESKRWTGSESPPGAD